MPASAARASPRFPGEPAAGPTGFLGGPGWAAAWCAAGSGGCGVTVRRRPLVPRHTAHTGFGLRTCSLSSRVATPPPGASGAAGAELRTATPDRWADPPFSAPAGLALYDRTDEVDCDDAGVVLPPGAGTAAGGQACAGDRRPGV